jgi:hypothetical protein
MQIRDLDHPPECPRCGGPLKLIDPEEEGRSDFDAFYGCEEYGITGCKGTRQIDPRTGLPEYTRDEIDDQHLRSIMHEQHLDPGAGI